ncbi:BRO-N domain-containing protein, partial [Xylella fastidiosa]
MTQSVIPFDFHSHVVRVVMRDGNPWFVAKDIAEALEYRWNASKSISHVPSEWRGVESVSTPSGQQEVIVISEPGLYFFLGRSDKPKALPFQKWLAGEVLPSIRKTGSYTATGTMVNDDALCA